MRVNTKIRYGLRALIEIARAQKDGGIYQKDIADHQKLSFKYLDQIIATLKASGLIRKNGRKGYILTRDCDLITIYDVYNAFEPDVEIVECINPSANCEEKKNCKSRIFWTELNTLIADKMKSVTIHDLINY